jgi:hypothetical protein
VASESKDCKTDSGHKDALMKNNAQSLISGTPNYAGDGKYSPSFADLFVRRTLSGKMRSQFRHSKIYFKSSVRTNQYWNSNRTYKPKEMSYVKIQRYLKFLKPSVVPWYRKLFEQVVSWGNNEISYIEISKYKK